MAPSQPLFRPMEKIMLGMTVFFLVGIAIFGFMPANTLRGIIMMGFVFAFTLYFMKPFGIEDKPKKAGQASVATDPHTPKPPSNH